MDDKLEKYLYKKYPYLFENHTKSMQETAMCWGISTGNGWLYLIDNLCQQITSYIKRQHDDVDYYNELKLKKSSEYVIDDSCWPKEKIPLVHFEQIKEKMGGLRVYSTGGDKIIRGYIDFAEGLSYHICEDCGKFDATVGITSGWIRIICKECNNKPNWKLLKTNKEISKLLEKVEKRAKLKSLS